MQLVGSNEAGAPREHVFDDGSVARITSYIGEGCDEDEGPQAFLLEYSAGPNDVAIGAHFHHVRQFQVIVAGEGARLGKKAASPITFHYVDPDSPYGPIVPGHGGQISFFSLRAQRSRGVYYMPGSRHRMKSRAGRNIVRAVPTEELPATGCEVIEIIERQPDGLAAFRVRLGPRESYLGPDPTATGGQYYLLHEGSVGHDDRTLSRFSLGWLDSDEAAPTLVTGDQGADLLILQCPVLTDVEVNGLRDERQLGRTLRDADL